MPRLNINKEFGFGWSWYDDWHWCQDEEEWMTNQEYEFHQTYGSYLCITKPLSGDNYPFRESFRTRELLKQGWDFRDHRSCEKVGNITSWRYAEMIIENNIGKSFDKAFSYYLKRTAHIHDRHYQFLNLFNGIRKYQDYRIDSEGNIQYGEWVLRWKNKKTDRKPYLFESADFRYAGFHKRTGLPMETYTNSHQWLRHRTSEGNFEFRVTSGYQVENVIPKSKLERRLVWEKIQKQRQLNKYWKNEFKLKQYSFLTDKEKEAKKIRRSQVSAKFLMEKLKKIK